MKKYFKQGLFVLATLVVGFYFSATNVYALDSYGTYDSTTGAVSIGIGTDGTLSGAGVGRSWALANLYGLPSGSILGIVSNILFWLLSIFAVLGIIGFIISGIFYLVAAGDEGVMEKGKEGMKWSIIGIIIGLSGFLIMQAVNTLLDGRSSTF